MNEETKHKMTQDSYVSSTTHTKGSMLWVYEQTGPPSKLALKIHTKARHMRDKTLRFDPGVTIEDCQYTMKEKHHRTQPHADIVWQKSATLEQRLKSK